MSSALERVREQRRKIAGDKTLVLDVPSYGGHLAIRYRTIPAETVNEFASKAARAEDNALLEISADLLVQCCDDVLVRQEQDGATEPIDAEGQTTFSSGTLPGLLGVEASSARQEVFAVFSPDGVHPMAVGQHADAVLAWLQGRGEEIDHKLLGG